MTLKQRWKKLLLLAWPLIIANSFWNIQLTIDRIFLGQYSTEALGAAMAVMGFFWIPMALLQQTAGYVTSFVSQYFGAKQYEKIGSALWQAGYVSIIGGILLLGLNWASPFIFRLMGHSSSIYALEVQYFNALNFSTLPTALIAAISGFFTGIGQTKRVMSINFVGLLTNILFDFLLISGQAGFPELGIAGAGYATAISAYAASLYGIITLWRSQNFTLFKLWENKPFNLPLTKEFLKFGIPSGLQWALEGLAFTVFLVIMGRLPNGEAALSSSSIAVTIMMLAVLPTMGIAQAVMTLVGQSIGEKKYSDAKLYTWDGVRISLLYISCAAASFIIAPHFYLSWFQSSADAALWQQVELLVPSILYSVSMFTLFDSIYFNVSFALKAAGDTRFVSLIALLVPWPIFVLPAILLINHPNAVVLSWRFLILYAFTLAFILTFRFKQGKWTRIQLITPSN